MPGPLVLFLSLASASLKPSRSMPVAVMAAQVCLMTLLVGVVLAVVLGGGGMLSWLLFVAGVLGLLLWPSGRWRIWMVLRFGFCCCCYCCCCWGLGLLLLLLLLLLVLPLPASKRLSIALSLSSNLFSVSAMMVSIAAWVMGVSRTSCGMQVGLGVLEVVVVVLMEEEGAWALSHCGGVAVWGQTFFPLFAVVAADCCVRFYSSLA